MRQLTQWENFYLYKMLEVVSYSTKKNIYEIKTVINPDDQTDFVQEIVGCFLELMAVHKESISPNSSLTEIENAGLICFFWCSNQLSKSKLRWLTNNGLVNHNPRHLPAPKEINRKKGYNPTGRFLITM